MTDEISLAVLSAENVKFDCKHSTVGGKLAMEAKRSQKYMQRKNRWKRGT